ncbi:MAG: IS110 family transposase [Mesorhizobium sp.]|nr:MAG: IS110 family transposase [Mesorhizobium sp.]
MRDELCRRLMMIPGVGLITALSFSTAIEDPAHFRCSRDVAAYFGLTSKRGNPERRSTSSVGSAKPAMAMSATRSTMRSQRCRPASRETI